MTAINTDKYGFCLGLFMMVMLDQVTPDEGAFRHDVMVLMGALKKRHLREQRLKNKSYFRSVMIADKAYRMAMDEMRGTDVTINATIARIFMQHKDLLKRVYGLDGNAISSLVDTGVQSNVFGSVKVSNCFMKHLNDRYEAYYPTKRS